MFLRANRAGFTWFFARFFRRPQQAAFFNRIGQGHFLVAGKIK
jgi:hypothetical protein